MSFLNRTPYEVTDFIIKGLDNVQRPKLVGGTMLVIYILILIGSLINIGIIAFSKSLHTPMYFTICSLAMVDIIYTGSMNATLMSVLLGEQRRVPYGPCVAQLFFFHLGTFMEPLTIGLMAADRLVAISRPLQYHSILSKNLALLLIVATWALGSALSGLLTVLVNKLPYCGYNDLPYSFCEFAALVRVGCVDVSYYFTMASLVGLFILLSNFSLIALSYVKIIWEVMKISTKDRSKTFSTCISHLIVVASYFIPKFLLIVATRIGFTTTLEQRNGLIIGSSLGPSLINPYVYCIRTKEIRSKLCIFKGSNINASK